MPTLTWPSWMSMSLWVWWFCLSSLMIHLHLPEVHYHEWFCDLVWQGWLLLSHQSHWLTLQVWWSALPCIYPQTCYWPIAGCFPSLQIQLSSFWEQILQIQIGYTQDHLLLSPHFEIYSCPWINSTSFSLHLPCQQSNSRISYSVHRNHRPTLIPGILIDQHS